MKDSIIGVGSRLIVLLIWWGWMPLVGFLYWAVINVFMSGMHHTQWVDQWLMANVFSGGPWLVLWIAIGLIGSAVILALMSEDFDTYPGWVKAVDVVLIAVLAVSGVYVTYKSFDVGYAQSKDRGRFYNNTTVFYTPSIETPPASLKNLFNGAVRSGQSNCDLLSGADVHGCIKQGTLNESGWDSRVGSLDGANIALTRRSGDMQKVQLEPETLVYLNAWQGQPARWSGILDGHGINTPMGGVGEWEGQGVVELCRFENEYAVDRGFNGGREKSMNNLLADKYPSLRFKLSDVWGYCEPVVDKTGKPVMDPATNEQKLQPVVVVPVTRQVYYKSRTVDTAAGIITIRGNDGQTQTDYIPNVQANEYPGPVYPSSLAAAQRGEAMWAAGRENRDRNGFGYSPVTSEVQGGNVSEYLLRNSTTGRLEYVTPLTLRGSSSELIVAYAIVPADQVQNDALNQLSVYVLNERDPGKDPRVNNLDALESQALSFFTSKVPTFQANGGKLVEFTPIDGVNWRAFGELKGQVVYRLDISFDQSVQPTLVSLNTRTAGGNTATDNDVCGQPLPTLTTGDLASCISLLADELNAQQQAAQGSPSNG